MMEQNYTDTLVTRLEKLWKWMSGKGIMLYVSVRNWMVSTLENYFTQPLLRKWNQVVSRLKNFGITVTREVEMYMVELPVDYFDSLLPHIRPYTLTNMVMQMKNVLRTIIWLNVQILSMMIVLCLVLLEGIHLRLKRLLE